MSPGRVHQLGQYVSGEVHNAVGQFVLGTKCLLTEVMHPILVLQNIFFFEEEMNHFFAMFFSALLNYSIFPISPSLPSEEQKSDGIC